MIVQLYKGSKSGKRHLVLDTSEFPEKTYVRRSGGRRYLRSWCESFRWGIRPDDPGLQRNEAWLLSCYYCGLSLRRKIRQYMQDAGFDPTDKDPYSYLIAADYYEELGESRRAHWLKVYESKTYGITGGELKLQW